ncbi:Fur-regulated basic protein FbpA [Geobacillus subterraneus]|uniref:Fur-regulated basic protein FbpA n=1 Tax=Geobacillus subterraneus TaxID=129338 RepID=UPI002AC9C350|nr:Fur-regulated basic protein FbpA [Geobacillus subterraneus]WPZ16893.1 Fur-regulated basic protein FbpA [Geobacillus subterraneus]
MGKWMRSAVWRQKQFYIQQLMQAGLTDGRERLEQWTMAELRREYERFNPAYSMEGGGRYGQTSARAGKAHH